MTVEDMTLFQSIFLGIIQGLTEFLPVSSSGHLVIVPHLFGWDIPAADAFVFDVLVQLATLVGVFAYFWHDLVSITRATLASTREGKPFSTPQSRLGWYVFFATLPAGWLGLVFRNQIKDAFNSALLTALFLLLTASLLFIGERLGRNNRSLDSLNWKDAIFIGAFQALALFPGVSRSGATITGAMTRDLERPAAARFSFLMSIPIMLAAGLLASLELVKIPNMLELLPVFIPGFIAAAVVGYLAIGWLLGFLSRRPLYVFAIYCIGISLITIAKAAMG
jgi:undecaprenyl-diphosphatase